MRTALFGNLYRGKRVLLTGHTGFKGAWMSQWLLQLGAQVHGLALPPEQIENALALFDDLGLASRLHHNILDVRDSEAVVQKIKSVKPDVIFHFAAQPLVRLSYALPAETFSTNVMGTVNVLEGARSLPHDCATVVITTDKCYENTNRVHGYREDDPMGGHDPYSASKGCAELVVASYQKSFFSTQTRKPSIALASARAGNVIGGGDFAADRIVPDCIRALSKGQVIEVRNRSASRPWQHVLEPLSGYLSLGAAQLRALQTGSERDWAVVNTAYNFGPTLQSNRNVGQLVEGILKVWPGVWQDCSDPHAVHEAKLLNLAIDKAHHQLGWRPVWDFDHTVTRTVNWYRRRLNGESANALTTQDLDDYAKDASAVGLAWTI